MLKRTSTGRKEDPSSMRGGEERVATLITASNGRTAQKKSDEKQSAKETAAERRRSESSLTRNSEEKKTRKVGGPDLRSTKKGTQEKTAAGEKGVRKGVAEKVGMEVRGAKKPSEEKALRKEREQRCSTGIVRVERSPVGSPNLEAHAQAIRERRQSLPRTMSIAIDNSAEVEIVIGDDGKPAFHPTVTPKTEEILQELTGILLDDDCDDEHENVKGPKLYQ